MKKIIFVLLTCLTAVTGWAGEPPKVLGIAFVRIKVTTEDSGGGFYHGTLRLPLMKSGCFGPDAECLFLRPSQQIDIIKMSGSSTGKQIDSFGFFTSDAIGLRRCLSAKGLKPGKLKTDLPFEISFPIKDPESHSVVFVQLTLRRFRQRRAADCEQDHSCRVCGEGSGGDGQVLQGCVGISCVLARRDEGRGDELGGYAGAGRNGLD